MQRNQFASSSTSSTKVFMEGSASNLDGADRAPSESIGSSLPLKGSSVAFVPSLAEVPPIRITTSIPRTPTGPSRGARVVTGSTPRNQGSSSGTPRGVSHMVPSSPRRTVTVEYSAESIAAAVMSPRAIIAAVLPAAGQSASSKVVNAGIHASAARQPLPPTSAPSRSRWLSMDILSAERDASATEKKRAAAVSLLSMHALQHCFAFLDPATLDKCVVLVCEAWHCALRTSRRLRELRFTFLFSGTDYDGQGIVAYLSKCHGEGRVGMASAGLQRHTSGPTRSSVRREPPRNPSIGACPLITVATAKALGGEAETVRRTPAERRSIEALRGPLSNVVSLGVSHFVTEPTPFAWVGIDLGGFTARVSHYTFGTSSLSGSRHVPVPTSWELQGCIAVRSEQEKNDWSLCKWHVLDQRTDVHVFSDSCRSATFEVRPEVAQRWGAMQRLRLMQMSRNSQWGHEFFVSGVELYGNLFTRTETAC